MTNINPEEVRSVQKALGMTEPSICADVESLKLWLSKQPHLGRITGVDEDKWLEHYLMLNKNSVERAKKSLDYYFSVRIMVPEAFHNRDVDTPEMIKCYDSTCIAPSPRLTPEGYRIMVYAHFTDDATVFNPVLIVTRLIAMWDVYLKEGVDRTGFRLICDLKNSRFSHIARYPPSLIKRLFDHCWKAYPERIASVHVINPSPVSQAILKVFLPFLTDKMRNRVFVHSNLEELYDHIPKQCLPSDYGGGCASMAEINRAWRTTLQKHKQLLEVTKTHKSNENLRPQVVKDTCSDVYSAYGHAGSFRKLAVD